MSLTLQISDKRGDAILLAKVETTELTDLAVQQAEAAFAAAAGLVGLGPAYEAFGAAPAATVPQVQTLIHPQQPAQQPWGQPPVPPFQPAQQPAPAPQVPAAAGAPSCQHGTKVFKSGEKNGRKWSAWACPARSSDTTRCGFEWIN